MSGENQRFRLGVAWMAFTEIEVEAGSRLQAEAIGQGLKVPPPINCGPVVHRIEQRVSVPGKPGEFQWVKVEARG